MVAKALALDCRLVYVYMRRRMRSLRLEEKESEKAQSCIATRESANATLSVPGSLVIVKTQLSMLDL